VFTFLRIKNPQRGGGKANTNHSTQVKPENLQLALHTLEKASII
jgi:hypothetical protein